MTFKWVIKNFGVSDLLITKNIFLNWYLLNKGIEKIWYFVTKIVLTYCEKKLF